MAKKNKEIENNFTHHPAKGTQIAKYHELREKGKELAYLIDLMCPDSREKSLAITNLEQSIMWANASIARGK